MHDPTLILLQTCILVTIKDVCSCYPIYPAALGTLLDTSRSAGLEMKFTPDLLVTPSDLAAFAKHLPLSKESEAVKTAGDAAPIGINPGRLAKGSTGGTFARLRCKLATDHGDGHVNAGQQQCRIDIIRV